MIDGRVDVAVVGERIAPRIGEPGRHLAVATALAAAFAGHCLILNAAGLRPPASFVATNKVLLVGGTCRRQALDAKLNQIAVNTIFPGMIL